MAYALKYYAEFSQPRKDEDVKIRLEIHQKDYTGASKEIGDFASLSLELQGGQADVISPIIKTNVSFSMWNSTDKTSTSSVKYGNWEEFYTNDSTRYKVMLFNEDSGHECIWTGYITPDSWSESLEYRALITVSARDMVGALSDLDYSLTDEFPLVRDIIEGAFQQGGVPMSLTIENDDLLRHKSGALITACRLRGDQYKDKTWYQALESVLESLGMVIRYDGQNRFICTSLRALPEIVYTGKSCAGFEAGTGLRTLDPAVKSIVETIQFSIDDYSVAHPAASSLQLGSGVHYTTIPYHIDEDGTGRDDTLTGAMSVYSSNASAGWIQAGASKAGYMKVTLPVGEDLQEIGLESLDKYFYMFANLDNAAPITYHIKPLTTPFSINIKKDGQMVTSDGSHMRMLPSFEVSTLKIVVYCMVGSTKYYYQGNGVWSTSSASTVISFSGNELSYNVTLSSYYDDLGIEGGDMYVELSELTVDGRIYFRTQAELNDLDPHCILVPIEITLSVPEGYGYNLKKKTTTIYNENYNVRITRNPDVGSTNADLSPLFLKSALIYGNRIVSDDWKFSDGTSYYPLAVMVHMQVLLYYGVTSNILSGTLVSDPQLLLPSYAWIYSQKKYMTLNGTYNFCTGMIDSCCLRDYILWEDFWEDAEPSYNEQQG